EQVGGATRGKAIIILNPAEPPMIMRDTVLALVGEDRRDEIVASIESMVATVAAYVPGYRLKQQVQFTEVTEPVTTLTDHPGPLWKVAVFLEVRGAAHYLPDYAGNLDIMTSAALQAARAIATRKAQVPA
ncbi:acetaldehyde dehydrogenase, partial [Rhodococcus rhodochrous KG-21]